MNREEAILKWSTLDSELDVSQLEADSVLENSKTNEQVKDIKKAVRSIVKEMELLEKWYPAIVYEAFSARELSYGKNFSEREAYEIDLNLKCKVAKLEEARKTKAQKLIARGDITLDVINGNRYINTVGARINFFESKRQILRKLFPDLDLQIYSKESNVSEEPVALMNDKTLSL
jgi:hypothetical protein